VLLAVLPVPVLIPTTALAWTLPVPVLVQVPLLAWARVQQLPPREACLLRAPATPRRHSCSSGYSPHTAQASSTGLLAVLPLLVLVPTTVLAWTQEQQLPQPEASLLRAPATSRWRSWPLGRSPRKAQASSTVLMTALLVQSPTAVLVLARAQLAWTRVLAPRVLAPPQTTRAMTTHAGSIVDLLSALAPVLVWKRARARESSLRAPATLHLRLCSEGHSPRTAQTSAKVLLASPSVMSSAPLPSEA
jgi:hypothetical protein